jgi:hypothetical protein
MARAALRRIDWHEAGEALRGRASPAASPIDARQRRA